MPVLVRGGAFYAPRRLGVFPEAAMLCPILLRAGARFRKRTPGGAAPIWNGDRGGLPDRMFGAVAGFPVQSLQCASSSAHTTVQTTPRGRKSTVASPPS